MLEDEQLCVFHSCALQQRCCYVGRGSGPDLSLRYLLNGTTSCEILLLIPTEGLLKEKPTKAFHTREETHTHTHSVYNVKGPSMECYIT